MNRRLAPSTSRRKPARKKPISRKPAGNQQARKRADRKNIATKKGGAAKSARAAVAKIIPLRAAAKVAPADRAKNRRKPKPKKRRRAEATRSWRERAAGFRQRLADWIVRRRGLFRRAGTLALFALGAAALFWLGARAVDYAHTADAFAIRA
ncbi:MAG: hypothetical protein OEV36_09350, partial [Myxococcales bacterium]|nr:hypothetical protein [Myxococcales bacterium]